MSGDKKSTSTSALSALRRAIDEVVKGEPGDPHTAENELQELERWAESILSSSAWRQLPVSEAALDFISQMAPDASVTEEMLRALEKRRHDARERDAQTRALESELTAESPGELLRDLRARAEVEVQQAAEALGITPSTLVAVEQHKEPWFKLDPGNLPAFAALTKIDLTILVRGLRLTAQRYIVAGVHQRAHLSLGRFDQVQGIADADRDRLRMALASMKDDNRGASAFLDAAERLLEGRNNAASHRGARRSP